MRMLHEGCKVLPGSGLLPVPQETFPGGKPEHIDWTLIRTRMEDVSPCLDFWPKDLVLRSLQQAGGPQVG